MPSNSLKGPRVKAIRVIAVGLLAAAVIMSQLSIEFFRQWSSSTAVNAFVVAMKSLSPSLFDGTGMGATAVIVLTFASAGLGLLASDVLYSPMDDFLASMLKGRFVVSSQASTPSKLAQGRANDSSTVRAAT